MGKKIKYVSDIQLGEKYRCKDTGVVGTAQAIYFFRHACERVTLSRLVEGKIVEDTFDALQLESESGKPCESRSPGGPAIEVNPRRSYPA